MNFDDVSDLATSNANVGFGGALLKLYLYSI